jgi:hypothetical protein
VADQPSILHIFRGVDITGLVRSSLDNDPVPLKVSSSSVRKTRQAFRTPSFIRNCTIETEVAVTRGKFLRVEGTLQNQDEVINVRASAVRVLNLSEQTFVRTTFISRYKPASRCRSTLNE